MSDNVHPLPNGADSVREQLRPDLDLAAALLLPNPDVLEARGEQLAIPVVNKPGPLEFFRTHSSLRLTLKMVTPNKGEVGAFSYAVMPAAEPLLQRYRFEPSPVTLYPIIIDSRPPVFKLVSVKLPRGREWDGWNLSKKLGLDMAVDRWLALRTIKSGYEACLPDPAAEFPAPEFPDWSPHEWLQRSLGAADLIVRDETHHVFDAIRHL
jgi:hypothetical protein